MCVCVYAQAYDEWEAELAVQEAKQARAQVKARGKAGKASAKGRAAGCTDNVNQREGGAIATDTPPPFSLPSCPGCQGKGRQGQEEGQGGRVR